jgi:hypothetical protein
MKLKSFDKTEEGGGGAFEHLLSLHIVYDILGEYEKLTQK